MWCANRLIRDLYWRAPAQEWRLWETRRLRLHNAMSKAEISKSERRSRPRLVARLPVGVRSHPGSAEVKAHTRDLSTNGVFLYTESRMAEGSDVELVLILPPELTSGEKCWVCCHARILRVERKSGKEFGVAAEIRRMDILPELPA